MIIVIYRNISHLGIMFHKSAIAIKNNKLCLIRSTVFIPNVHCRIENMYGFGLRMYSHNNCLVSSFNNEMQVVHYLTGLTKLEGDMVLKQ